MFSRQLFRTHRPFRALVMDTEGSPILWVCILSALLVLNDVADEDIHKGSYVVHLHGSTLECSCKG